MQLSRTGQQQYQPPLSNQFCSASAASFVTSVGTDDLFITREFHTPRALDWPASTASTKATQVSQHDQIEVMYAKNTPTPEAARGLDARGSRQVARHSMPPRSVGT